MHDSTGLDSVTNDPLSDDAFPVEGGPPRWVFAFSTTIAVGAWITAAVVWFIAPKFMAIFVDFDTELPSVTLLFFRDPRWAIPLLLVVIGGLVIAKDFVLAPRNRRRINLVVCLGVAGVFFGFLAAMFLPLVKLIQGVSA